MLFFSERIMPALSGIILITVFFAKSLSLSAPAVIDSSLAFSGSYALSCFFPNTQYISSAYTFTITIPNASPSILYYPITSIQSFHLNLNNVSTTIQIFAQQQIQTEITMNLYTLDSHNIKALRVRYLAISEQFTGFYAGAGNQAITCPNTAISSTSPCELTISTITDLTDLSMTGSFFYVIIGLGYSSLSATNQISIGLSFGRSTISQIQANITTSNPASQPIYNWSLIVSLIIFNNEQYVNLTPYSGFFTVVSVTATNPNTTALIYEDTQNMITSQNVICGINQMHLSNASFIDFDININPSSSSNVTLTSANNWLNYTMSCLIAIFYQCPTSTKYLLVSNGTCYDICPVRYYNDATIFKCTACNYDCYQCSNSGDGLCTSCNSTIDFREMDNITSRCVPLPEYYDIPGQSTAAFCNQSLCLTCTSLTDCTSCHNGSYLSGTTCIKCFQNCQICNQSASCEQCVEGSTYQLVNGSNACIIDCTLILHCTNCFTNSTTNETTCSQCQLGYYLNANYTTCTSSCGDGILIDPPQQCDDGNTINGDGCSSTCMIDFNSFCILVGSKSVCTVCPMRTAYNTTSNSCQNCPTYDCYTCNLTTQLCTTCDSASNRILNLSTMRCQPQNGYYDDGNFNAVACDPNCFICNGSNNSSCQTCQEASSITNCNSCIQTISNKYACLGCGVGILSGGECVAVSANYGGQSGNGSNSSQTVSYVALGLAILFGIISVVSLCCLFFCAGARRSENKVSNEEIEINITDIEEKKKHYELNETKENLTTSARKPGNKKRRSYNTVRQKNILTTESDLGIENISGVQEMNISGAS